jgi:hypothetical protein
MWLRPPKIYSRTLSGQEAEEADHMDLMISKLDSYTRQFQTALSLFDHCETILYRAIEASDHETLINCAGWPHIAARDAAMAAYHFGVTLGALQDRIRFCPSFAPYYDKQSMRLARKLFKSRFPRSEWMRHSISHAAGLFDSPDNFKKHTQGPLRRLRHIFVFESLNGHTFTTMFKGEMLSFSVSSESLTTLERSRDFAFDAFRPIEIALSGP